MPVRCRPCAADRHARRKKERASGIVHRAVDVRPDVERIKDEFKSAGCVICGVNNPRAISAHHMHPPDKAREIGSIYRVDELAAELAKCVPLCHTHHYLVHLAMRSGHPADDFDSLLDYVRTTYPLVI